MNTAVVLLSGGMDSTVLAHYLVKEGYLVRGISFNYGQRHSKELGFAIKSAEGLGIKHTVVNLSNLSQALPGSSQTDPGVAVPEGRYDEESMKATVVPNRNMILLSIAAGYALAHQCRVVAYAAHSGDHAIYPDCRPEFADAMSDCFSLCDRNPPALFRPFIGMTKADICKLGNELGVDWKLTWSCYKGHEEHCGKCGTCVERREAFYLADVTDPTPYHVGAPTVAQMVANDWNLPK